MKNVTIRKCYFKECLAYYDGEKLRYFYGISRGTLSYEKKGINSNQKWSELWYIFIPLNGKKTLAEMSDKERNNRNDNHTSALKEFAIWFVSK